MLSRSDIVALGLALVAHAALTLALANTRPTLRPASPIVEVALWRASAPPVATIPEPEKPKAIPRKVERRHDEPPPNATPTEEPPKEPPMPALGVTASSTVQSDSAVSVPVGNTTMIDPNNSAKSTGVTPLPSAPAQPAPTIVEEVPVSYRSNEAPAYPAAARRLRLEGTTIIRVLVDVDGRPKSVKLQKSGGAQILDDAAVEAVQHWSFVPARRGNKTIATEVDVPVVFRLDEAATE